jgi:dolichol-phosphate mannosyltransferase
VPVHNEEDNVAPLVGEIVAALRGVIELRNRLRRRHLARRHAATPARPAGDHAGTARDPPPQQRRPEHRGAQRRQGRARRPWIATLDGDGQNDPADIPKLLAHAMPRSPIIKLFAGWRVNRQDSGSKRWASKWANAIRARLLRDDTPDTGCGIKLFEREAFLDLPYFDHMHRYLPALMQRAGWKTVSVPVNHRRAPPACPSTTTSTAPWSASATCAAWPG